VAPRQVAAKPVADCGRDRDQVPGRKAYALGIAGRAAAEADDRRAGGKASWRGFASFQLKADDFPVEPAIRHQCARASMIQRGMDLGFAEIWWQRDDRHSCLQKGDEQDGAGRRMVEKKSDRPFSETEPVDLGSRTSDTFGRAGPVKRLDAVVDRQISAAVLGMAPNGIEQTDHAQIPTSPSS